MKLLGKPLREFRAEIEAGLPAYMLDSDYVLRGVPEGSAEQGDYASFEDD